MKFRVKEDLGRETPMHRFAGMVGSSPMKSAGLMIPLTFEDDPDRTFVFYPWEVDALPKEK